MTPVEFHFVTPSGVPLANTPFEIQLERSGFDLEDTGVVIPRLVDATTDGNGNAVVSLWPNVGYYHVTVEDLASKAALHYKFLVPELSGGSVQVRLQDIVVTDSTPVSYEEATLLLIYAARTQVLVSKDAAAQSAIASENSKVASGIAAQVAINASNTLNTDRTESMAAAAAALVSQNSAAASAATATTKSASATASATQAASSLAGLSTELAQTTAQAVIATNQAANATASAVAAANSANSFVSAFLQTATSMIATQNIVAQHHAFS
jgi:hypothetical protein